MEETPNAPQTDDEKRKQAIERRLQEQEARKEMIRKSLAEKSNDHTTFSDDDDEKVDDAFVDTTEEQTAPKDADKWMFDDSDEDSDVEIKINPVLEGEAGRKRLELQSKFKGDERFKLGEDFIDEDEHVKESEPVGDEISQGLGAEKDQAMDVLRAMFGVEKVTPRYVFCYIDKDTIVDFIIIDPSPLVLSSNGQAVHSGQLVLVLIQMKRTLLSILCLNQKKRVKMRI
jgi:hypothetical protein